MSEMQLPDTWTRAKLRDIAEIVGGGTPSRDISAYFQGNIPWATPTDITKLNGLWIDKTSEAISQIGLDHSSANLLPIGTVLMTSRASIGDTAINPIPIATNQGFANFICDEDLIENEYLAFWLPFIKQRLIQLAGGTTFKEISKSTLSRVEIPLPPLPEQRRIAAILREADEIRKLRQEANEKTQQIVEALFYDMFGDPIQNEKKWKIKTIKDICNLVRGSSPRPQGDPRYFGGSIPRLMVADMTRDGLYVTPKIDSLTEEGAKASRPMKAGSVVMAVSGAPGLPAILNVDACIHDGFVGFRDLSSELNNDFFLHLLLAIREKNNAQAVGATFKNLKTDQINDWSVLLPPIQLQNRFSEIIADVNEIDSQIGITNTHFNDFFQSLLSQAFTGELTASWREQHAEELLQAARERDDLLQQQAILDEDVQIPAMFLSSEEETRREELIDQLSPLQRAIYDIFVGNRQSYFTASQFYEEHEEELLEKKLRGSLDQVKRELYTLKGVGLIIAIALPVRDQPGRVDYVTVYRYPQPEDDTTSEDLELLALRSV